MRQLAAIADDEVKAVASMASLALALLGLFTNIRREALATYIKEVEPLSPKTVIEALPDILLAALTGGAILAMAPLVFDTFSLGEVGRRAGALDSMFGLIWLGFVVLLVFQLSIVFRRFNAVPRRRKKTAKAAGARARQDSGHAPTGRA